MARRHATAASLLMAQTKLFAGYTGDIRQGHAKIALMGRQDALELSRGQGASGKARVQMLARLGHPYGRGSSAANSHPLAGQRLTSRSKLKREKIRTKGMPMLPLGVISGGLRRGWRISKSNAPSAGVIQKFDITNSAAYSKYILHPSGTKKMVGRGITGTPDAKGALGQMGEIPRRWRARSEGLRRAMIARNRQ